MVFQEDSKNVLILEDLPNFLQGLVKIVQSLDYIPLTATSRQEFIGIMQNTDYFAVILDNNAPYDKNGGIHPGVGLSLAAHFLRAEPQVKVALHTSGDLTPEINEYVKKGLIYIKKPASEQEIRTFLS